MIDTDQIEDRNEISGQNNGNYDKKRQNLVKSIISNQKEEQNNTQDSSTYMVIERGGIKTRMEVQAMKTCIRVLATRLINKV